MDLFAFSVSTERRTIKSIIQNTQPDITTEDALKAQEVATKIMELSKK